MKINNDVQQIEIPLSKIKIALLCLGALLFVALGLLLIIYQNRLTILIGTLG